MRDDQWVWPERRDLYRACLTLANPHANSALVTDALDILLNDLELYDDPHQGKNVWLFPDETVVANDLAIKLHSLAGSEISGDWGDAIIGHSTWPGICADAQKLLGMIRRNGQGMADRKSAKRTGSLVGPVLAATILLALFGGYILFAWLAGDV